MCIVSCSDMLVVTVFFGITIFYICELPFNFYWICKNAQLKKNYEQRCREVDAAEDALRRSVSLVSKDEEKVS